MKTKVLIIDDDAELVEATTTLLTAKGYSVVSADCGEKGFALAKAESPQCILLDVMMTYDSEGLDTVKKLKADASTKNIPVVMITGIRKAMNLPFGLESDDEYLPVKEVLEKPVKPEMLLGAVERALGRK